MGDLFDSNVLETIFLGKGVEYGLNILGAIACYVVGRFVANLLRKIALRLMEKRNIEPTIRPFIGSSVKVVVMVGAIIAAISQLGVDTTSLIALLGTAGVAIGFALKDSLSNIASGVILLVLRPFKIGDFISVGSENVGGDVQEISFFTTAIQTIDGIKVIIPNDQITANVITNYTANDLRRIDMTVGIAYDSSINDAIKVIKSVIESNDEFLSTPKAPEDPLYFVKELADSSVNIETRVWVNTSDYWPNRFALNKLVKQAFDENGIEIPFPQRSVHLVNDSGKST